MDRCLKCLFKVECIEADKNKFRKAEKPPCSNYALLNLFFLAETENPIFGTGSIH